MKEAIDIMKKISPSPATVLIIGESGTGKELVAKAIHYNSPRRSKPFTALNCAAIPENLFESELFGYEPGAFTGAAARRIGLIESTNGGTLFLDEIGDLPQMMQSKLLRVLQDKEIRRLGGRTPSKSMSGSLQQQTKTWRKNLQKALSEKTSIRDEKRKIRAVAAVKGRKEDIPIFTFFL